MDRLPDGIQLERRSADAGSLPPPEIAEFIRYAHRRRRAAWPEIYDDMWAVAARGEFRGWDLGRLAEQGVAFTLLDTPRLAGWVRAVLPEEAEVHPSPAALPISSGPVEAASTSHGRHRTAAAV